MGKCTWMTAIAGGVLASASVALAEPNATTGGITAKTVSTQTKNQPQYGIARMPLAPEDIGGEAFLLSIAGPVAAEGVSSHTNDADQAIFCGICDFDAVDAQETPLPTSWTQYGDAFANRADAIAGKWLRDQGCFIIIGCWGTSAGNAGNALRLPASFDYTSSLPNFKICGWFSNFDGPNDAATSGPSVFAIPPANGNIGPTLTNMAPNATHPSCLNQGSVAVLTNQRDQDYIRFTVPAGGINNFRVFVTGGQNFEASLLCNKNFPNVGNINGCWTDPNTVGTPPQEFGFVPVVGGNPAFTTFPAEGQKDSTWAFPLGGVWSNIPQGEYILTIRLVTFGNLTPPNTPTEPTRRYQMRVIGEAGAQGTGACCNVVNNTCADNVTLQACAVTPANRIDFYWRGAGTTCADGGSPGYYCQALVCPVVVAGVTIEGASRDCVNGSATATDLNIGCIEGTGFPSPDSLVGGDDFRGKLGYADGGGANYQPDYDAMVLDNFTANPVQYTVTINTEMPIDIFSSILTDDPLNPCLGLLYVGIGFAESSHGDTFKICIPANSSAEILLRNGYGVMNCAQSEYCLKITTGACEAGACCNLTTGNCSQANIPNCYASGGVFLGEGVACADAVCCSASSACTGSTRNEGEPVGNCVTAANFNAAGRDSYNPGCDATNPVFTTVSCFDKVCGTTSNFNNNSDTDWYSLQITSENYYGAILSGQVDLTLDMYTQKADGTICPSDGNLASQTVGGDAVAGCLGIAVTGDCFAPYTAAPVAGTRILFFAVATRFSAGNVPCEAKYLLEIVCAPCVGTSVACPGGGVVENESNCQATANNQGCNAASPTAGSFVALNCNQTLCGTGDLLANSPDRDWVRINHPGGDLKYTLNPQFFGQVTLYRKGTTGAEGCGNLTFISGLIFVNPNVPETVTETNLAAGTYYLAVQPDVAGTSRVCCGTNYTLKVECAPPCPCTANLIDNPPGDVCKVNTNDLTILLGNFGKFCTGYNPTGNPPGSPGRCPNGYLAGDFNQDGTVNTADLTVLLGQFGKSNVNGVCQ